jgi:uncharacterized protein YdaU (DUF1376 family)
MADFPFMNTKTAELLADTTHLSAAEFGGYWRLCIAMWRNGGYLPAEEDTLRKYSTLDGRSWSRSRETILRFFDVHDEGIITQKTVTKGYQLAVEKSGKASESAFTRWQKVKNTAAQVATRSSHAKQLRERDHLQDQSDPNPLKTNEPDYAAAFRSQCERHANYKLKTIRDDDDARARVRAHGDDPDLIPFDKVDDDQVMIDKIAHAAGVKLENETKPLDTLDSWRKLELSEEDILDVIRSVRSKKKNDPPERLAYFTKAMNERARSKKQPKLQTIDGGKTDDDKPKKTRNRETPGERRARERLAADLNFARSLKGED